jgi:uncharacterized RDD family membrane protein YckC
MTFAKVRQHIGAFLLDYLIIAAYLVLLVIINVGLGFGPLRSEFRAMFADPTSSEFSAFLLLVLPIMLYFALCECSSWQATWGKRKMGLRVIDTHGARLSLPRSLSRSFLKLVPWELTHACLWRIPGWPLAPSTPSPIITVGLVLVWILVGAYLVSMLVSKKHQALYDWIAGTAVIVEPHPRRPPASEKQAV